MSSSPDRIARFGVFELNPRTGELRKRGARVRLQDQPFQVLTMLVERAGDLVTREEVRERLWSGSVFVAFDQALNNAIAKVRAALGDSAENPRFVETLERRGYRFLASVEWAAAEGPLPPSARVSSRPATNVRLTTDDRTITLQDGTHVIGREPDAAVWIDSAVVSRRHAELIVHDGRVTIEDLGSRNGTFVNGTRPTGVSALVHGDEIRLGTLRLVVHVSTGQTATRTVDDNT
jgi:DNA-binding winged helix-turn-helix (wHTH) protein